uniref:Uncharacterized protein n=1 Tax=Panagrolaimus sp. ES5 TaxID=591445 RepID=A0AC34FXX3_9BILA
MLRLTHEVLFDIAKELIEAGNEEDVYKFALSGKEPFQATAKAFATLELYNDRYVIGWDDNCTTFEIKNYKPPCKFLLNQIGNCVLKLSVNTSCHMYSSLTPYQSVLDKIITKKQLVFFTCDITTIGSFVNEFLPKFSSTLKYVTVQSMTETLRDTLILKSLTILDSYHFEFAPNCCKTSSLVLQHCGWDGFERRAPKISDVSPFLSLIKDLTFNENYCYIMSRKLLIKITKYFPALESLNVNITLGKYNITYESIEKEIKQSTIKLVKAIKQTIKVPEKITCNYYKFEEDMKFPVSLLL